MPRHIKEGNCVYCGEYAKLTRDHVIPLNLFSEVEPLPDDIPIVDACAECNNKMKSVNDTYLRDMLVIDRHSSHHPIAQKHWGKFARASLRNQSQAVKDSTQSILVSRLMPSGNFASYPNGLEAQTERTRAIMTTIVRGLHYTYIGRRLPETASFEVYRIPDMSMIETNLPMLLQAGAAGQRKVGDGQVFECVYLYMPTHPGLRFWFLCFYKSVYFSVVVWVPEVLDDTLQNAS